VSTQLHSFCYSFDGEFGSVEREKEQIECISGSPQLANPRRETAAGERGFECDIELLGCQVVETPEHYSSGFNSSTLRVEFR
jgi:hypothetical protein